MSAVETALEAMLFGSAWYFGYLIILTLTVGLIRAWKWSGVLILPLLFVIETQYYNRLSINPEMVWAMIVTGILILFTAIYTLYEAKQERK